MISYSGSAVRRCAGEVSGEPAVATSEQDRGEEWPAAEAVHGDDHVDVVEERLERRRLLGGDEDRG